MLWFAKDWCISVTPGSVVSLSRLCTPICDATRVDEIWPHLDRIPSVGLAWFAKVWCVSATPGSVVSPSRLCHVLRVRCLLFCCCFFLRFLFLSFYNKYKCHYCCVYLSIFFMELQVDTPSVTISTLWWRDIFLKHVFAKWDEECRRHVCCVE